jgi:hypothetical protein
LSAEGNPVAASSGLLNSAVRLKPYETKRGRSRVTNGADLLPGIDGRSPTYRRYRDLVAAMVADLGGIALSEARMQLVRRFAASAVLAEAMEARLVKGEPVDIMEHSQLASTQVRLASRIGLERMPKDVTPATLQDYINKCKAEAEDDDCVDVLPCDGERHTDTPEADE